MIDCLKRSLQQVQFGVDFRHFVSGIIELEYIAKNSGILLYYWENKREYENIGIVHAALNF